MTLKELLDAPRPPEEIELTPEELTRLLWKYKGLHKQWERANAFWQATNGNLKHAYEKLDEKDQELERAYDIIQDDLVVASQIQHSLLPQPNEQMQAELELAVYHAQLAEVGGDYYDFFSTKSGRFAIGLFDISGHGVAAALVMTYLKAQFMQTMERLEHPWEIVESVNTRCFKFLTDVKKYATVNFVRFAEDHLSYVSGGGFGFLLHQGEPHLFQKRSHFLGLRNRPFPQYELPFTSGDLLAMYTDGMIEAQNDQKNDYTVRRLNDLITVNAHRPVQEILEICLQDYQQFKAQDSDDITLLICRRK